MLNTITPVILCGGSGTRLWPLSRKSFPKQFVPLIGNKSLLQLTVERVKGFGQSPLIVAADEHRFMVSETLQSAHSAAQIILEPVARNTAAAMALAALHATATEITLDEMIEEMAASDLADAKKHALLKKHGYEISVSVE